jgi:hypothetical protein
MFAGQQWITCREGSISYTRQAGGRYYVKAKNQRAMLVTASDLPGVLNDLIRALGGRSDPRPASFRSLPSRLPWQPKRY